MPKLPDKQMLCNKMTRALFDTLDPRAIAAAYVHLKNHKVSGLTLFEARPIGAQKIVTYETQWMPDDDGEWAITIPVVAEERLDAQSIDNLIDIVAFTIDTPEAFFCRWNTASFIGSASAPVDLEKFHRLRIHRTPLGWLQSGLDGLCILDPDRARADLSGFIEEVCVDDWSHGREIQEILEPAPFQLDISYAPKEPAHV